uniref:ATP-dependent DNA helicase n=1 Tax=Tanacetum cinerariifolium TaxID=118510 RepID=A0A6L2MZI2_TANCI|nr:ATP-dependent DNA helicase PIF1-like [Tanacetum cinerariifolium]
MDKSGGSSMARGSRASETPEFKCLLRHPSVTTPSKVNEAKKQKRGEVAESDDEASFVTDTQAASGVGGSLLDTRKHKRYGMLWMTMLPVRERQSCSISEPRYLIIILMHRCTNVSTVMRPCGMKRELTREVNLKSILLSMLQGGIDHSINNGKGVYTFRVNGQSYHRIGSLLPKEDTQPRDGVDAATVHTLIHMLDQYSSVAKIDDIISVELPSPTKDLDGYRVVTDYMLHGPFSKDGKYASCTTEGRCSKHYPKQFYAETVLDEDGPTSIEWCNSSKEIKYLNKDPDRATIVIQENILKGDHVTSEKIQNYCLVEIQELLNRNGRSLTDFQDLPRPNLQLLTDIDNRVIRKALNFDMNKSRIEHERLHPLLNPEQRLIYKRVIDSVHNKIGKFYFVYGPGGTGKTFLYNTIIARLRTDRKIVLAVASSGMRHYYYPVEGQLRIDSSYPWNYWKTAHDEAPMTQKYAFEALDKTLRDILGFQKPEKREKIFCGMTVLLGVDFRQHDEEYLKEQAILTPRNDDVDDINTYMFKKLSGKSVTYNSAD